LEAREKKQDKKKNVETRFSRDKGNFPSGQGIPTCSDISEYFSKRN